MTDISSEQPSKLEQIRKNDVDIVISMQEMLLEKSYRDSMTYSQIIELLGIYGELYHSYAMNPEKWLRDV